MFLTQVCNVGSIVGGTAACAWSVTRALPDWQHLVIFLGRVSAETRRVFAPIEVVSRSCVSQTDVDGSNGGRADIVLFHNTPSDRCERLSVPTICYRHSRCEVIDADIAVDCSRWLAGHNAGHRWMWQGVPRVRPVQSDSRATRQDLVIGRICTPRIQKWPEETVELTAELAASVPLIRFEFIVCPRSMQALLRKATGDRATFFPVSWAARERLAHWDLLVYSNRGVTESFGRTVAEAMRAGCIPVVDRNGGFIEQLENGGGVLCDKREDFVEAVRWLSDPFERRSVSRQASAIAEENFSLAAFRGRLLELMNPLLWR